MTHPDYRGAGLFVQLAQATYQAMTDAGLFAVWGFPNSLSHRGFVRDLAWQDVCELPTFRLQLPYRRSLDLDPAIEEATTLHESLDDLWREVSRRHCVAAVRDRAWLDWRYRRNPVETYRILVANDSSGSVDGYVVLKRHRHEMHIVDLLAKSDDVGIALTNSAIHAAQREDATALSLWLPVHTSLHLYLERMGFKNEQPVTYLGARNLAASTARDSLREYRNWYLSMGDSDVY